MVSQSTNINIQSCLQAHIKSPLIRWETWTKTITSPSPYNCLSEGRFCTAHMSSFPSWTLLTQTPLSDSTNQTLRDAMAAPFAPSHGGSPPLPATTSKYIQSIQTPSKTVSPFTTCLCQQIISLCWESATFSGSIWSNTSMLPRIKTLLWPYRLWMDSAGATSRCWRWAQSVLQASPQLDLST